MSETRVKMSVSKAILEVSDLVKHYPIRGSKSVVHAVNNVSFKVYAGETLALIGESGSGKTTVGRCILKLIDPTSGNIKFRGVDFTELKQSEVSKYRAKLQMVFQEPYDSLNPRMTIAGILDEPLRLAGQEPKARTHRIRELIEMVRLNASFLRKYPHQLTDGQQQRIGIARAIATEPDLVVLDEPTSALDISVRAEIIWLLKRLQGELGLSYIFISHDLTAVREISHRVAIMYLGQIVEVAASTQVFAVQLHPYGKALLSSVLYPDPCSENAQVTLHGEIPSPVNLPTGCFLHPRCPFAIDRCSIDMPRLEQFPGERRVSCWRADDFLDGLTPELLATGDIAIAQMPEADGNVDAKPDVHSEADNS